VQEPAVGASASLTTSASSTVPAGTPDHCSGGDTFSPPQAAYCAGNGPPSTNSGLYRDMFDAIGVVPSPASKVELEASASSVLDVGAVTPGGGGRNVRPSPVSHAVRTTSTAATAHIRGHDMADHPAKEE
jgi:hypothetical protein